MMTMTKRTLRGTLTLIHVLAAERPEGGTIRTRSTVRVGNAAPGDRFWYEGVDRTAHALTVISVHHSTRWATIVFAGLPDALSGIGAGTYIRSQSGEAPLVSSPPSSPGGVAI
jgi:hypothetical protein